MTTRSANVSLKIDGADQSRQDLDGVRQSMEGFSDASTKGAQKIVDGFANVEKAEDRLTKKITEGRIVGERDAKSMASAFHGLETTIKSTFGSLEKAPQAVQEAFAKAQGSLERTNKTVGQLNDAVKDNAARVRVAAGEWPGLTNALEGLGGKIGSAVQGFKQFSAALGEGWALGMKFNKLVGTDMSEFDFQMERLGKRAKILLSATADELVAFGGVVKEVFTPGKGYVDRVLDAQEKYKIAVAESARKTSDLDAEVRRMEESHKSNAKALEANTTTVELATDRKKKLEEATAKLNEATAKLNLEIDKSEKGIKKQTAEIEKNTFAMMDAEHVVTARRSDQDHFGREVDKATLALKNQTSEVESLTAKYGANDPMVLQAIASQKQLEQELARSSSQYDTAKKDVDDYQKKQKDAAKAIETAKHQLESLNTELKKQQTELAGLPTHFNNVATATTALATAAGQAAPETARLATALKGTAAHGTPAATAITAAVTALSASDISPAVDKWERLEKVLAQCKSHMSDIAALAPSVTAAMNDIGEASGKAAGSE